MAGFDRGVFSSLGGDGSLVAAVAAVVMVGPGGAETVFTVPAADDFRS
jgi:hypothetical protein